MNLARGMYLRPGNLWKTYRVMEKVELNQSGHLVGEYRDACREITGVLAQADSNMSDRTKHLWDQDQHSLTHTMVVRGRAELKKEDMLTRGEKAYLVLLVDDIGALGMAGLVYLQERNDVK